MDPHISWKEHADSNAELSLFASRIQTGFLRDGQDAGPPPGLMGGFSSYCASDSVLPSQELLPTGETAPCLPCPNAATLSLSVP